MKLEEVMKSDKVNGLVIMGNLLKYDIGQFIINDTEHVIYFIKNNVKIWIKFCCNIMKEVHYLHICKYSYSSNDYDDIEYIKIEEDSDIFDEIDQFLLMLEQY